METIRIMSRKGDEELKYNPDNADEVKKVKTRIKELLKKGWYFYGMKAGDKKMKLLTKEDDIEGEEFNRYIMAAGTKKVVSPPPTGG